MTIRHSSRHAIAPAIAALLLTFACGDPTGPPEPLVVTITTSTTFGPVLSGEGEEPAIRCGFRMIASATGPGRADWQGAVLRFYAGADRTAPLDTAVYTEEELLGVWARDSISVGSSRVDLQACKLEYSIVSPK